ncbi:MAG: YhdT family protein [Firmicutes bacterium]|nr:YhdT family protein [Bacillota bacterium]
MEHMTNEQKHKQILKEVKATFILIAIVAAWHIGFGFLLEDIDILVLGMPLWFFVSTIGAFVVSAVGVVFLVKKVFKNFDLGEEAEEGGEQND